MRQQIEHLKVKFILGSVTLVGGLVAANIALFQWVERTGVQYLLGNYTRYVLGLGGFAAMIFGATLINDAWVLKNILKGKYEIPKPKKQVAHEHRRKPTASHSKKKKRKRKGNRLDEKLD